MKEIFETFKPKSATVQKYVDYYYLDIKPKNSSYEFQCFPHFKNTISIYQSHKRSSYGEVYFDETASSLQIFTPIREKILHVKQVGPVYRIVIVFRTLGIQQFFKNLNFADYITAFEFFDSQQIQALFSTTDTEILASHLDDFLEKRYKKFEHPTLEKALQHIFEIEGAFSVAEISNQIGISRQHLNRIFQANLGISIKKFHEIVLFRKTMHKKLFENPQENLTDLAYSFNFNDQSHFIKTYKNLTEKSPRNFFKKGTVLGTEDTFWHLPS